MTCDSGHICAGPTLHSPDVSGDIGGLPRGVSAPSPASLTSIDLGQAHRQDARSSRAGPARPWLPCLAALGSPPTWQLPPWQELPPVATWPSGLSTWLPGPRGLTRSLSRSSCPGSFPWLAGHGDCTAAILHWPWRCRGSQGPEMRR